MAYYILPDPAEAAAAMEKFAKVLKAHRDKE
jgi:hypothetical protein